MESVEADFSSAELVEANSSLAESVEADSGLMGSAASSSSGISFSKKWHNLLVVLTLKFFFSYGILVIPSLSLVFEIPILEELISKINL